MTVHESIRARKMRLIRLRERRLFTKVALVARRIPCTPEWLRDFVSLAKNFRWPELTDLGKL